MAGVLNFTLGLEASKFLSELGVSSGRLLSFAAIAEGVSKAFEKIWQAIEQGGQLQDLASQNWIIILRHDLDSG